MIVYDTTRTKKSEYRHADDGFVWPLAFLVWVAVVLACYAQYGGQ